MPARINRSTAGGRPVVAGCGGAATSRTRSALTSPRAPLEKSAARFGGDRLGYTSRRQRMGVTRRSPRRRAGCGLTRPRSASKRTAHAPMAPPRGRPSVSSGHHGRPVQRGRLRTEIGKPCEAIRTSAWTAGQELWGRRPDAAASAAPDGRCSSSPAGNAQPYERLRSGSAGHRSARRFRRRQFAMDRKRPIAVLFGYAAV